MSRLDRLALLISLTAVLVSYWISTRIYEAMPHLEDEMAYAWQADAIAHGSLSTPIPPERASFLVPFVVDYNGQRFGKYPPGWPVVLAMGVVFGGRALVNPLLSGFGVWLTYLLGKRALSETVGVLAAGLTLTSPFFLINAGSLLSHPLGLALSAGFALAWLDAFTNPQAPRRWLPAVTAGAALGLLAVSRPFTALAVAVPFGLHGVWVLLRGSWGERRRVLAVVLIAGALALIVPLWQYAMTGDPLLNPYILWWKYDKIGFGPEVGLGGHTLSQAWVNTRFSLWVGYVDLFGWLDYSWVLLPVGLAAILWRRNGWALLLALVAPTLVAAYMAYWVGASLYGPRYYYEGLYSLTLISAAGIAWLTGWPLAAGEHARRYPGLRRFVPLLAAGLLAFAVAINLIFYIPLRVGGMRGLYGISRAQLDPFVQAQSQGLTPALIVVYPDKWTEYGGLLEMQSAFLDSPFIFIYTSGRESDARAAARFPARNVYYYDPRRPYTLLTAPPPEQP
jgi:4-amino-4-deoxy-L-arabinose transferase-like glycosyltransferase